VKSKVALIKGPDRYRNITQVLESIAEEIKLPPDGLLIKPNFVSTTNQLASTHVEGVRALLDFLKPRYGGSITIGEAAGLTHTFEGFRNFGYMPLIEEYGVRLMDLNRDQWVKVEVYDRNLAPLELRLAKTARESPYRISIGPPKTHDTVIITLSLKNMIMGSLIRDQRVDSSTLFNALSRVTPSWVKRARFMEGVKREVSTTLLRSDRSAIHQGYPAINLNLYTLAKYLVPHLSIIDGFLGMEGPGPSDGEPVELQMAVASTDFLAADTVGAKVMGYDIDEIGYLYYCKVKGLGAGDLEKIEIVGNARLEDCIRPFRPHPAYHEQLRWQIPNFERFL
jgi:uncharacterized protein (DUF362 family)